MDQKNQAILERLKGGLVVSCQALPEEPLHSSYIMSRMAYAAYLGGDVGIRANTVEDITEIRKTVDLPIIGIIKKVYADRPDVYITPTMAEVDALVESGVEIIALDANSAKMENAPQGLPVFDMMTPDAEQMATLVPDVIFVSSISSSGGSERGMTSRW